MARLTGLFLRGGNYYLRVVLPENHPLRARHKCGRLVQTLGASTYREAVITGTLKRAEILAGYQPLVLTTRVNTPERAAAIVPAVRLGSVYAQWVESKSRTADSNSACARALRLFEQQTGNMPLSDLTRTHGESFRSWLQSLPTTSKTARDRLNWVKVLLKYAHQDLGVMPKNTWAGLEIKSRTTLQRQPWSDQEISKLLGHPIWQNGELPRDTKAGGVAAYWIPLLALHTGARCSELCQLRLDDIDISGTIATINITDQGDGQQVKSQAGLRTVPIHSELIRLGFAEYIASLKGPLVWPDLPQRKGKPGGYFSHYFSELRRSLDVPPSMVLHSFRHNVRTALSEANIPEAVIDKLLGHEAQGSIGARVYTHVPLKALQSAMAVLTFPTSSLKKLPVQRISTKTT